MRISHALGYKDTIIGGYVASDAACSAIAAEAVRRARMDPHDMEDALIKGILVNDNTALEIIEETMGPAGLQAFLELGGGETPAQAADKLHELGLHSSADHIEQYRLGVTDNLNLFDLHAKPSD